MPDVRDLLERAAPDDVDISVVDALLERGRLRQRRRRTTVGVGLAVAVGLAAMVVPAALPGSSSVPSVAHAPVLSPTPSPSPPGSGQPSTAPSPSPSGEPPQQSPAGGPPPAWIEAPTQSKWMSLSTYCWGGNCSDDFGAFQRPGLPRVQVAVGDRITIHLAFDPARLTVFGEDGQGGDIPRGQRSWTVTDHGPIAFEATTGGDPDSEFDTTDSASYVVELVPLAGDTPRPPTGDPPISTTAEPPPAWVGSAQGSSWMAFGTYCWGACIDTGPVEEFADVPRIAASIGEEVTFNLDFDPTQLRLATTTDDGFVELESSRTATWTVTGHDRVAIWTTGEDSDEGTSGEVQYVIDIVPPRGQP